MVKHRYYCDICGAEMPEGYAPQIRAGESPQAALKCTDLCDGCVRAFRSLDVTGILREATLAARSGQRDAPAPHVTFVGGGSLEKQSIYDRLVRCRNRIGLGAYVQIAVASGGKLTDTDVNRMANGEKMRLEAWKALDAALQALEKEENDAG